MAALAGCKEPDGLVSQTAMTTLDQTIFVAPNNVQTLTFTAGAERDLEPLALTNLLFAKHWLACKAPEDAESKAVCTFEPAGRNYARANGWTQTRSAGGCARCETWSVPVATAELRRVVSVALTSKTQASATYEYSVVPTEFGAQLADYMARNRAAWCGPIPSTAGGWFTPRSGTAEFTNADGNWELAQPAAGFAATFGDPAASGAAAERRCAVLATPALEAPRRNDHAYALVGGPWSCESVNGEPSIQRYVLGADGSITLHDDVRVAKRSYDIVETYRFDPARGLWDTTVRGGGYAGAAMPWSGEKWVFNGIETERGRRSKVRMVYTQLGDQAYRRDFQLSISGETFVSETCKRT